jgi:translocator protein
MRIAIRSETTYRGRNSRPNPLVLMVFVGLALAVGAIDAVFSPGISATAAHWYAVLAKPDWLPPNSWFAPVWVTLYVLMGTAAWIIWRERYHRGRGAAISAYAIQLLLNGLWAPLFFGLKNIGAGLFVIVALWLAVVWTIREFARVKGAAAFMLLPYLIWVSVATAMNLGLWKLNQ